MRIDRDSYVIFVILIDHSNRKNKTLRAAFGVKEVLAMCERVSALPRPLYRPFAHSPQNYKVYCTLNNIPIDESIATDAAAADDMDVEMDDDDNEAKADDDNDDAAAMDEDDDDDMPTFFKEVKDADAAREAAKTPSRNPKSRIALVVKAKVNKVLGSTDLAEKRARQCDQNDFLKLLLGTFARDIMP